MSKLSWVVVHCSAGKDRRGYYDTPGIFDYHINERKYADAGYQELIDQVGERVYSTLGRPPIKTKKNVDLGAHAKGFNNCSYGICVIGKFDEEAPSEMVWNHLIERLLVIMLTYGIPVENVIGHWETLILLKEAKNQAEAQNIKTCPGLKFDMDKLRADLFERYKKYVKEMK